MKFFAILSLIASVYSHADYLPWDAMECPVTLPWVINDKGYTYYMSLNGGWTKMNEKWQDGNRMFGKLQDISCLQKCWAINRKGEIWEERTWWVKVYGKALAIDVGYDMKPWIVNKEGRMWRWVPGYHSRDDRWSEVSGAATDVSVVDFDRAWVTNKAGDVWYYKNGWVNGNGPGNARKIAVGKKNTDFHPWITTRDGKVFKKKCNDASNCGWTQFYNIGQSIDINVKCGVVYVTGWDHSIWWIYEGANAGDRWTRLPGAGVILG